MNNKIFFQNIYLNFGNEILPSLAKNNGYPIKNNHCFFRIILDYVCGCKWNTVLSKPGYKHLNEEQLLKAIDRMSSWTENPKLLIQDNKQSLNYRKK